MELNSQHFAIAKYIINQLTMRVIGFSFLIFSTTISYGQTWNEIFKQNKTQIKYLGQQIAALQLYTSYLQKGYEIAGNSINNIKDIKNGEFSLHQAFISSLKSINPGIKKSPQILDIIAFQLSINHRFKNLATKEHSDYVSSIQSNVQNECSKDLEELLLIITAGKLELSDDERLIRVNEIYERMHDKYMFCQSFSNDMDLLNLQKSTEQQKLILMGQLNGFNL